MMRGPGALLFLAALAHAAQIGGVVTDTSSAAVVAAQIIVSNEDTGLRRVARTSPTGHYAVAGLPAGSYRVTVRQSGFQTESRPNLALNAEEGVRVDFVLQPGEMRQTVTVEDRAFGMGLDGATSAEMDGDRLAELPLHGRGVLGLLELAPGVVATPAASGEAGQFSAIGQRPNTNYFSVDGVSFNTGIGGSGLPGQFPGGTLPAMTAFGSFQSVAPMEAVEEARVQSSGFAPEFGRLSGAQVSITTRSGTNSPHGALSYNAQNDRLNAADWFANRYALGRIPLRMNQAGAAIGGPVRRDRTYFFASYEGLFLTQPYVWRTAVPLPSVRNSVAPQLKPILAVYPLPNGNALDAGTGELIAASARPSQSNAGSLRVDHSIRPSLQLSARYNQAPSFTEAGYAQISHTDFDQRSFTLALTAAPGANMTNELRFQAASSAAESAWRAGASNTGQLNFSSLFPDPGAQFRALSIGGLDTILNGAGGRNSERQINLIDVVSIAKNRHQFRAGLDFERLLPERSTPLVSEAVSFPDLLSMLALPVYWLNYSQNKAASTTLNLVSLFAQDTWRLNQRVTLTYGLRWELAVPPPAQQSNALFRPVGLTPIAPGTPLWSISKDAVDPRLGIAWRLGASGKTVVRGGAGIFHDASLSVAAEELNGVPFNSYQLTSLSGPFGGAAGLPARPIVYAIDPGLKLPYSLEWSASVEHAWTERDFLSIGYGGSRGFDLLRREAVLGTGSPNAAIESPTNHGSSSYHSMRVRYERRLSRGVDATASYTWSHSIDNGSWDSALWLAGAREFGSSNFDVRHNLAVAISWRLPRGFALDAVGRARTGFPLDVLETDIAQGIRFADALRPDLVAGVPLWVTDGNAPGGRRLNVGAFAYPAKIPGNLGRNAIAGFGMAQLDMALHREFRWREATFDLRGDVYNVSNHPWFANPERIMTSPLFGSSLSMANLMLGNGSPHSGLAPAFQSGGPRTVQVGFRLRF